MKKFILFMAFICFLGLLTNISFSNDIIQRRLPRLKKDVDGVKLPPLVVYNRQTGNYETINISVNANGSIDVAVVSATVAISGIVEIKSIKSSKLKSFNVAASSLTATLGKAITLDRTNMTFKNRETYTVYLATYAADVSEILNLIAIDGRGSMTDSDPVYTGAWYILGANNQSTSDITLIEKRE